MKKLVFAVSCAMTLALSGFGAQPKPSNTTYAADALKKYIDSGELPGAVNVFFRDGVEEVACLGYADPRTKRPVTLDSTFMQCSQTKGFCGVTIAKLVEEGKLNLDNPVSKYIPEFKTLWYVASSTNDQKVLKRATKTLTVRMVMNHTGGFPFDLPNYGAMGGWSRKMPLKSVALTAAAQPLNFEPGTEVKYSNTGIDIGAAVVEVITKMRWEDYLKKTVFDPLGMNDSTFYPTDEQLSRKIELYGCRPGKPAEWVGSVSSMQPPFGDDRVFSSAGAGLWTTARDQLKFYKMLMNLGVGENGVRILKEDTVKKLLAVSSRPLGKTASGQPYGGYSLGLSASEYDNNDDKWFGHGGAWGTNCQVNWHKKQLKLWVVQLVHSPRPWDGPRNEAATKFFNAKIDTKGVDAYTGRMK